MSQADTGECVACSAVSVEEEVGVVVFFLAGVWFTHCWR